MSLARLLGRGVFCTLILILLGTRGAWAHGIPGVGSTNVFPAPTNSGRVAVELWAWSKDRSARRLITAINNGAVLDAAQLPDALQLQFRINAAHDEVRCRALSSDCFDHAGWQEKIKEPTPDRLYHLFPDWLSFFRQVGRYCVEAEGLREGRSVGMTRVHFQIVNRAKVPRGTHYLHGKTDTLGNPITWSKPVEYKGLNETARLRDNDYEFEPQHAYNVVNFERFPPFELPPRFIAIWNSRRFSDEEQFGGPLDRGFTTVATIRRGQDNVPISQRGFFHTPDLQVQLIHDWLKKEPDRYPDLKAYADHRSAWVSASNSYKLGWACYNGWGAGGWAPYDAGLYGWDEEQMWPTIGEKLLREHPELVPEELRHLRESDPQVKSDGTKGQLHYAYTKAWGDFMGYGYRAARDAAATRGRAIKIWHYGSKAPGEDLFVGREDGRMDEKSGQYRYERLDRLWPWFKKGNQVDYTASEYARQIDYFHKDFYYHTLFPQTLSMYEKDSSGAYRLDDKGRRKIRRDVAEETVYGEPVKIGHEDYEIGPVFLKAFLAKGENALYFLHGGKYPKQRSGAITDKQLIPALRPGNQETWGESAKLGSRPVNPYLAEAAVIYTFMMGLEGLYYWDARLFNTPAGSGPERNPKAKDTLGDIELAVKGLHRVSQLNPLFEGNYSFVRPVRHYETYNRDHPIIRGVINGRYLALAMTNPYLDPGETQQVELWYDRPYEQRTKVWSDTVTLHSRKTHLVQCKLPRGSYDPDRLYLRYTCKDSSFEKTFTVTGNYDVAYPF